MTQDIRNRDVGFDRVLVLLIGAVVFLILLMPLIVTPATVFPYIVGKSVYVRSMIEVAFGLWLVLAFRYPSYRPPRSRLLLIFAFYVGITLLAGLLGVSPQRSLWSTYERMQGVIDLAHWLALTVVLASVFRSFLSWRYLLNFNLGVSIVMALLGVAQHYDVGSIPFYDFLQANPRLDITLGNPTFVGAYMLVNALIGLGFLGQSFLQKSAPRQQASRASERRRQRRRAQSSSVNYSLISWRLFWLAAIALDLWILSLTGTRGAFIGLGAGLMAFAVVYMAIGRVRILRFAASGLIGLLALVALIFVFGKDTAIFEKVAESNVMIRRVSTIGLTDSTLVSRLDSISAGLEGFAARPILGWGPENYNVAFGRYIKADSRATETFDQVHSKPIEELTTKGALGFLSYMTLWAFMFWVVFRKARRQDAGEQFFTLFIGATLVGYFVQNLFLFDTPATLLQFILLLGYVVTLETSMVESAASEGRREEAAKRQTPKAWLDNLLAPVRVRFQQSELIKRLGRASIFSSELRL
ncbi:MAG: O-antigen ligase family protein, partial [Chloroflexi bacterium]|nr:O-antigen ligase family protein [Chloroflexota bacterium]